MASALALQCSTSLSYEDPYTGGRPIYWVHQPVKGMKHRMKWCELREYKWNEYVTIAVNRNRYSNYHAQFRRGLSIGPCLFNFNLIYSYHWLCLHVLLSHNMRWRNLKQLWSQSTKQWTLIQRIPSASFTVHQSCFQWINIRYGCVFVVDLVFLSWLCQSRVKSQVC